MQRSKGTTKRLKGSCYRFERSNSKQNSNPKTNRRSMTYSCNQFYMNAPLSVETLLYLAPI